MRRVMKPAAPAAIRRRATAPSTISGIGTESALEGPMPLIASPNGPVPFEPLPPEPVPPPPFVEPPPLPLPLPPPVPPAPPLELPPLA